MKPAQIEKKISKTYNVLYVDERSSLKYLGVYEGKYLFGLLACDKSTKQHLDNFYILSDTKGNLTQIIDHWINNKAALDTEFHKIESKYKYFEALEDKLSNEQHEDNEDLIVFK
jgi:hypothetical protein